ncbi:hypothetical protein K431DRAFT_231319 [Polychaeton citri CBS 116435]|uniref:Uncharacterized protein n=1 Tax=Polychaeton citri CBS 116435 TaxID=1314669 RepID=A0A9P4Q580_9PEZI|nr:hypothetical protein K431DRAFT_231319 [Polychaeton citri CBS 116435]
MASGSSDTQAIDGVGVLNYQRAIDIARNTEGDLDPNIARYLQNALKAIWDRVQQHPDTYILTKDEFAVFNFYRHLFHGSSVAECAIARYWQHTGTAR